MTDSKYYEDLEGAIAVIGMSGAFSQAKDIDEYWNNILEGKECLVDLTNEDLKAAGIPEELYGNPHYVKRAAALETAKDFDSAFFGYTPAEARVMDPQHRLFLEHSWKCLEDGNVLPEEYDGLIGVFGGCSQNNYLLKNLINTTQAEKAGAFQMMLGNDKDYLTTKVSYKLNLKGPSITMQTACSTSLTAIQQGCLSLLNYQSDMALCGGASVNVPFRGGYLYQDGLIFSPKGKCRAFDAEADGTVFGDGVGVVLLKRLEEALEDGDNIYAIVRGSAINNDGSEKVGYTAPSVRAQSEVIATALAVAEVPAETVGYVEAHGTGTLMGDPIEVAALTDAFRMGTEKKGYCTIGSVKPNIGHLDAAAGVASFIKAVLVLNRAVFPPQANYSTPNPALNLEESPFVVNRNKREWTKGDYPRRAGVNSLGVGGTNIHLILEEYVPDRQEPSEEETKAQLLPISAKSEGALRNTREELLAFLNKGEVNLPSAAYTLQKKRVPFPYRDFLVLSPGENPSEETIRTAINPAQKREAAFLFTGQGSQYPQMGRGLYEEIPAIRTLMDDCFSHLKTERDLDLKSVVFPEEQNLSESEEKLMQTTYTQPALFILEYALARYLQDLGIQPACYLGHSLGEYTAACLSGVFTLKEALCLVADRGRIMQKARKGSMISIPLSAEELKPFLTSDELQISVINTPERCVVSGTDEAVESLKAALDAKEIRSSLLKTSHAYHSFMMEGILDEFSRCFTDITWGKTTVPVISNLSGDVLNDEEIGTPAYWIKQLRETVNFEAGVSRLLRNENLDLIEVGPGRTLSTLSQMHPAMGKERLVLSTIRGAKQRDGDYSFFLNALGRLWQRGFNLNWEKLYEKLPSFRRMPGYGFDHNSYWIESEGVLIRQTSEGEENSPSSTKSEISVDERVYQVWGEIFGRTGIKGQDNFYDMGGHSVLATQLLAELNDTFDIELGMGALLMEPTPANSLQLVKEELNAREEEKALKKEKSSVLPMMFPIQRGDTAKPPLFIVSGMYFNSYHESDKDGQKSYEEDYYRYFSTLVNNIGTDQPVYGFRPKGIFRNEKPHRNVKFMAAAYIGEMKKVQPSGPYLLGGECIGGVVTYEMAAQLVAGGDKVKHLILMDTFYPHGRNMLKDGFLITLVRLREELIDPFKAKEEPLSRRLGTGLSRLQQFILPLGKKQWETRRLQFSNLPFLYRLIRYSPQPFEDTEITLLANKEWRDMMSPSLDWKGELKDGLKIIEIPGDHVSRLTEHGPITGKHIRDIIDRD